jgi:uncharacterized tellurite resistance protein B-like protein
LACERAELHTVIERQFGLDDATAHELMAEAIKVERDAVDPYHFTSLINRTVDEEGRRRIVEMMWEIIYADGDVSEFESNLMWRAAELLGISPRQAHRARPARRQPARKPTRHDVI